MLNNTCTNLPIISENCLAKIPNSCAVAERTRKCTHSVYIGNGEWKYISGEEIYDTWGEVTPHFAKIKKRREQEALYKKYEQAIINDDLEYLQTVDLPDVKYYYINLAMKSGHTRIIDFLVNVRKYKLEPVIKTEPRKYYFKPESDEEVDLKDMNLFD